MLRRRMPFASFTAATCCVSRLDPFCFFASPPFRAGLTCVACPALMLSRPSASLRVCVGAALKTRNLAENWFRLDISPGVLIYTEDAGLKHPFLRQGKPALRLNLGTGPALRYQLPLAPPPPKPPPPPNPPPPKPPNPPPPLPPPNPPPKPPPPPPNPPPMPPIIGPIHQPPPRR